MLENVVQRYKTTQLFLSIAAPELRFAHKVLFWDVRPLPSLSCSTEAIEY
jgi:hypothetical protein